MIFKLEKNVQKKKENTWKIKNKTSKLKKKNVSKINGQKKERQKGKNNGKKMDLSI